MQKKYFLLILFTLFPFFFLSKETFLFADDDEDNEYKDSERSTEEYYEKRYEESHRGKQSFQPDTTTSASSSTPYQNGNPTPSPSTPAVVQPTSTPKVNSQPTLSPVPINTTSTTKSSTQTPSQKIIVPEKKNIPLETSVPLSLGQSETILSSLILGNNAIFTITKNTQNGEYSAINQGITADFHPTTKQQLVEYLTKNYASKENNTISFGDVSGLRSLEYAIAIAQAEAEVKKISLQTGAHTFSFERPTTPENQIFVETPLVQQNTNQTQKVVTSTPTKNTLTSTKVTTQKTTTPAKISVPSTSTSTTPKTTQTTTTSSNSSTTQTTSVESTPIVVQPTPAPVPNTTTKAS